MLTLSAPAVVWGHLPRRLPRLLRPVLAPAGMLLDLIVPPTCCGCKRVVETPHGLCPSCWGEMTFITPPLCPRLGVPFAYDSGDRLSARAVTTPPVFTQARGAVTYDGLARHLVHQFKYHDRLDLAILMARLMHHAGAALLREADLLIPVPLHWTRLWTRRYNQAAILARRLERVAGRMVGVQMLVRCSRTQTQVGMRRSSRVENVGMAFRVPSWAEPALFRKRVVLVDDVLTTGSTVNACASALLQAGVAQVDVLVFAIVPDQDGVQLQEMS